MICSNCGVELNRQLTLVGTVTRITEDAITVSITEPEERKRVIRGKKTFGFPFVTYKQGEELPFCTLNCFKEVIHETLKQ